MFQSLKQASAPNLGETHEDQLAQIPVDIQEGNVESYGSGLDSEQGEENEEADSEDESRGINLIASDNELRTMRKKLNLRTNKTIKGKIQLILVMLLKKFIVFLCFYSQGFALMFLLCKLYATVGLLTRIIK